MSDLIRDQLLNNFPVILLALGIDLLIGDPPSRYHPVAWIGSLISWMKKHRPKTQKAWHEFVYGGLITISGIILFGLIGFGLVQVLGAIPTLFRRLVSAILLKTLFSFRMLTEVGHEIYRALKEGYLIEARRLVSWHLVSRDTSTLNETKTAAAAIESIAENTSDSIIAPLFYYFLFGLPGALVYRFVNTADAMLGYQDTVHEWLGKIPARTDDVLNFIPARLTALLFLVSAPLAGGSFADALKVWMRDRQKTESPNAGHPMSAAAGALNIELEKVGYYVLGKDMPAPEAGDLISMVSITRWSVVIFILVSLCIMLLFVGRNVI